MMAAVDHGSLELGTADGEHPRGRPHVAVDHAAQDLERRQHLIGGRLHAQSLELGLHGGGAGARVVGEEGQRAPLAAQERQHVGGPRHEHVAGPHAAVQIEDEAAHLAQPAPGSGHAGILSCAQRSRQRAAAGRRKFAGRKG